MTSRLFATVAVALVLIAGVALATAPGTEVGYRSHIFLVNREGGVGRLTGGRDENRAPTWCRSGRRIVAVGKRVDVRAARDGRLLYRLNEGPGSADSASPSPDCRRFAVVSEGRLVLVNLRNKRHVLVRGGVIGCGGLGLRPCPIWSVDGRTLYYGCGYNTCAIRSEPGSEPREVIHDVYSGPRISTDGEWLAFVREDQDPQVSGVWIARPDGSDQRHLLGGASVSPRVFGWVPGRHDVYAHGGGAGKRTIVISPSGRQHRIGPRFGGGGLVALSPDRKVIAWTRQRSGKDIEVRSSSTAGGDSRALARFASKGGLTEIDTLEWSPNGGGLLVEPHRHIGD